MNNKKLNCLIIGCGLLGLRRAEYIKKKVNIIACCDNDKKKLNYFKKKYCCISFSDWKKSLSLSDIDFVIISTPHYLLSRIAISALQKKKHIFLEKPGGVISEEIKKMKYYQDKFKLNIYIAYNHLFHPSIIKSKQMIDNGDLGELMYMRGRYGHGGRIGYNKEWRAIPKLSGGGEVIDQGSHLINLSIFFLGKIKNIKSYINTFYWDMDVEDNGFIILRNFHNKVSFLHASCTEWKNMFSLEIYGKKGKLEINGLGGSYGTEKLTYYKMLKKMGPPKTYKWSFRNKDKSWQIEIENFLRNIKYKTIDSTNIDYAHDTLKIINKIYKQNKYDYSKKST
jgi:predicted dehydrogenase